MSLFFIHHVDLTATNKDLPAAFTHVFVTEGSDVTFVSSVDNVNVTHVRSRAIETESEAQTLCRYLYGLSIPDEQGSIEVFGMDIDT